MYGNEKSVAAKPRHAARWIFASLRGLKLRALPAEIIAGLTLFAIAIPEQLATARLAGMAPEAGLFAFAAGSIAFAAFGASRFISVGADSTIAPIFAGSLAILAIAETPVYADLAGLLALMVGGVLVVVGVLRAGWIADLLSIPVATGFLAGISVHIIIGQLPAMLGVATSAGTLVERLQATISEVPQANGATVSLGMLVFATALGADKLSTRIPGALLGLVGAALATWKFDLAADGVHTLAALSSAVPTLTLPAVGVDDLVRLAPLSLTIALVCMMQTAAVVRAFPSDRDGLEDISQDFAGLGAGSVLAGLFGAFPVNSSPPRTALVVESGGRSQLTGLIAVVVLAVLVTAAGAAFVHVPEAALAGILIFIAVRIFRIGDMISIARKGRSEILLVAASAALVVLLPVERGVIFAIVLSLLHSTYLLARPLCPRLVRLPNTTIWWSPSRDTVGESVPGVLVFSPAAPLTFLNADYICSQLDRALAETAQARLAVIEASGITLIDYTGAQTLIGMIARLRERGIDVALARLDGQRAVTAARRNGLLDAFGVDHVFHSVEEAVRAFSSGSMHS